MPRPRPKVRARSDKKGQSIIERRISANQPAGRLSGWRVSGSSTGKKSARQATIARPFERRSCTAPQSGVAPFFNSSGDLEKMAVRIKEIKASQSHEGVRSLAV